MEQYPEVFKLFDAGFVASNKHPVLEQFQNGPFQQMLQFTDKLLVIINHTNLEYVYVSESVKSVLGYSVQEWKDHGVIGMSKMMHPADLDTLGKVVFPAYFSSLAKLNENDKLRSRFTYTYRLKNKAGKYIQMMQDNVILKMVNDKITLGMAICTDNSAFKKTNDVHYSHVIVRHPRKRVVLMENVHNCISPAESRVLALISGGLSEKQIADKLHISVNTVKTHKHNMLEKAGVKNSAELVRYGAANLLI